MPRFRGRTRKVGQIRLAGIPFKEQTPQVGQNERAQVRNFSCYTWKSSIHCGGRPSFLFTHTKKRCQTPHAAGSNPTNLEEHKRRVRTLQSGQVICVYTEGQKAGLTPHLEFDPAIGALCKHGRSHISPLTVDNPLCVYPCSVDHHVRNLVVDLEQHT